MVSFPFSSFQVNSFTFESSVMGRFESQTSPFTSADNTFLARPSLMLSAISCAETPDSYSRLLPSGNVMLIIFHVLIGLQN